MADHSFDAIVIGEGIAGFAAALALHEKGKKVAIVSRATGATSVSSGAWDFGAPVIARDAPVIASGAKQSFLSLTQSPSWKEIYSPWLSASPLPSHEAWIESTHAVAAALKDTLPLTTSFEVPLILPSMAGSLRCVYAAQKIQAEGDLNSKPAARFAVISSRRWRFRGDLLCRQWNEKAKSAGLKAEFRATDLPLESDGWDVPLARVCANLMRPEYADRFKEALSRLSDSVDALILPPVFPSNAVFDHIRSETRFPVSESLSWTEPVAGYRFLQAMHAALDRLSIPRFSVGRLTAQPAGSRVREISVSLSQGASSTLKAESFVLATGRFFGGGLEGGFHRLEETVFGLPVYQDAKGPRITERRSFAYQNATARLGIRVDKDFRPLAEDGKPAYQNLVACGSIIGGIDYAKHQVGLGFFALTGRQCVASAL